MSIIQQERGLEAWTTKFEDYISGLSWSFDNTYLCIALSSGKLAVVNANKQKVIFSIAAHEVGIISITHSPKELLFLTAGQDGLVKLWETSTGKLLKQFEGGWQWVEHLKWSPNGAYFVMGSGKNIKLYARNGELVYHFINPESTVSAITWKKDSSEFALGSYGNLKIFDVNNEIPSEILPWRNSLISLSWSPDGKFICAGTQDSRIHFWPLPFEPDNDCEMSGYAGKVKELSWAADSSMLASNCGNEIVIWEISGKAPVGQKPIVLHGHKHRITSLNFAHSSNVMVSGDTRGVFLCWYPKLSTSLLTGGTLQGNITALSWCPNDQNFAVGTALGEVVIVDTPI